MTVTLTEQDFDAIKLIADIAVARGIRGDSGPLPHLRVASVIWPVLAKLEAANLAGQISRNPTPDTSVG